MMATTTTVMAMTVMITVMATTTTVMAMTVMTTVITAMMKS